MKKLFGKLKQLTGYGYADIAREFNISKQFMHQSSKNYSMTYTNSNKFMINRMVDKKIKELEHEIETLNDFKDEVNQYKVVE